MRPETLAETLRWLNETGRTHYDALMSVPEAYRHNPGKRADYLRGYDDRQPEIDALQAELAAARQEFAEWLDASRTALDTHAALQARVRELEATILDEHSRLAQAEAKPAAVGVVGTVRWGCLEEQHRTCRVLDTRESAQRAVEAGSRHGNGSEFYRVVAIVDPAQIVPLVSGDVKLWMDDNAEAAWDDRASAIRFGCASNVTPLYPGIAQPAQERAG
jgi:hypothetical protein